MAKTAIVNPRRKHKPKKRARKRNPSTALRTYGSARRRRTTKRRATRRRNPTVASVYTPGGYRQKNPDLLDIDHMMQIVPAATAGIWAVRWAMKLAGPFEQEAVTGPSGAQVQQAVPGIKHAIAGVIAARMGSGLIGQALGDASKAHFAEVAALGFIGDLFMRTRVLAGSAWVADNLMLQGVDEDPDAEYIDDEDGGEDYDPSMGAEPQMMVGPDGVLYQLSGGITADPAYAPSLNGLQDASALGGMQDTSALGRVRGSNMTGFGYA